MADNLILGKTPKKGAGRDAVHVAVVPVVAQETLYPGQVVGLDGYGAAIDGKRGVKTVGIVDPFLSHPVHKDEAFYLLLFPGTITSLRHVWEHPGFPPESSQAVDDDVTDPEEAWAREEALKMGRTLEGLFEEIEGYEDDTILSSTSSRDRDNAYELDWPRLWKFYEKRTGIKVPDHEHIPFSCSC